MINDYKLTVKEVDYEKEQKQSMSDQIDANIARDRLKHEENPEEFSCKVHALIFIATDIASDYEEMIKIDTACLERIRKHVAWCREQTHV